MAVAVTRPSRAMRRGRGGTHAGGLRGERGVGIVEFALVALVFFTLLLGIVDGAWYVAASNAVSNAAREGARRGVAYGNSCTQAAVLPAARRVAGPFSALTVTVSSGVDAYGQYCDVDASLGFQPFGFSFPFVSTTIVSNSHEWVN